MGPKIFYINFKHCCTYQIGPDIGGILSHWGQVMHLNISKQNIIGSDNGLMPGRHQAIIWTNAGILLIF